MKKLTKDEFEKTFGMFTECPIPTELSEDLITCIIDALTAEKLCSDPYQSRLSYVYERSNKKYLHVLINYGINNIFLVIVLEGDGVELQSVSEEHIIGYYILDIHVLYGLEC